MKMVAKGILKDHLVLVADSMMRTDQEKARYTFLDDMDYLIGDNAMDNICLSPELDGTLGIPTFEHSIDHQNF
jgi:DNA-directed RNA polymerase-5 subunit 1